MIKKILLLTLGAFVANAQTNLIHHEINAVVKPINYFISVIDEITIPEALIKNKIKFKLFSGLIIEENSTIMKLDEFENAEDIGMDKDNVNADSKLKLNIAGKLNHQLNKAKKIMLVDLVNPLELFGKKEFTLLAQHIGCHILIMN